jgi:hypothetical protein
MHFTNFCNKLECFFPGRPIHPIPMFAYKATAYLSEAPFMCATLWKAACLNIKY